jgi:hypothetical protein
MISTKRLKLHLIVMTGALLVAPLSFAAGESAECQALITKIVNACNAETSPADQLACLHDGQKSLPAACQPSDPFGDCLVQHGGHLPGDEPPPSATPPTQPPSQADLSALQSQLQALQACTSFLPTTAPDLPAPPAPDGTAAPGKSLPGGPSQASNVIQFPSIPAQVRR